MDKDKNTTSEYTTDSTSNFSGAVSGDETPNTAQLLKKDKQSRKYQLTFNNFEKWGYTYDIILKKLTLFSSLEYYAMSTEIGIKENTPHIHLFLYFKTPTRFSTIYHKFKHCHIESCRGTCAQNRDYVFKEGKWANSEKGITSIPDTRVEWGKLPEENVGEKPELALLLELIQDGLSNYDIITKFPDYLFDTDKIDRVRKTLKQEEFKDKWRDVEVTYIFGKTGTGKTRGVMEKYGYSNVFRCTQYDHPFDLYQQEEVIIFEEFSSSIRIQDLLNIIDGYPVKLPCRYSDKIATFTKVFFCTNTSLEEQYPNIRREQSETWEAFLRRIDKVIFYKSKTEILNFDSVADYMSYCNQQLFQMTPISDAEFNRLMHKDWEKKKNKKEKEKKND